MHALKLMMNFFETTRVIQKVLPPPFVNIRDSCMIFATIEACNPNYKYTINSF